MPAALIMSNLQAAFRRGHSTRRARRRKVPPPEPQRAVNLLETARFVTYFYGVYDSEHQVMVYCNAVTCAPSS